MEWFYSLLHATCPYCQQQIGTCFRACDACALELAGLDDKPRETSSVGSLTVVSLARYENWIQEVLVRQKHRAHALVIRSLAKALAQTIPQSWSNLPLVWIPGPKSHDPHLVERLAQALERLGCRLYPYQALERKLFSKTPQKKLGEFDRRTRNIHSRFRTKRRARQHTLANQPVILLDDIVTTGSTLTGCTRLLEENLGLSVAGALTLAVTPKHML